MKNAPLTASIYTLGCRVNQYESDAIAEILSNDGFVILPCGEPCDVAIVNTCTVTAESDRKSRQLIRRVAALNGGNPVIVTGCFSQVSPDEVPDSDGVVYICGNSEKDKIPALARRLIEEKTLETPVSVPDISEAGYDAFTLAVPHRTRSYVKIEDGCENRCAYCIIPRARGKVRSKSEAVVLAEAEALGKAGCREIILTGIETASYGRDFNLREPYGTRLAELLKKVNAIPGIERIGMGSLEPTVMSDVFTNAAAGLSHVLPHFHLSVQSGSTSVLHRMRRRYTAEQALECIERMKRARPDATFSADFIVGFPGETDAEFKETLQFCRNVRFLHLHIFPYSPRKGTEAETMPGQLSQNAKHERLKILEQEQEKIKAELLREYVQAHSEGKTPVCLLVEKVKNGRISGHSEHYVEVSAPLPADRLSAPGDVVPLFLTDSDGETCRGTVAYDPE